MANLSFIERNIINDAFKMNQGYVLDFSDKTLQSDLKHFPFSVIEKNKNKTRALLEIELSKAKSSIKGLKKKEASNWLLEKVDKVEKIIGTLDPSDMSEKSLQKFMTLSYMTNIIIED